MRNIFFVSEGNPAYYLTYGSAALIADELGYYFYLASLWIHYLPAWRSDSHETGATADKLIKCEGETRHQEIIENIQLLDPIIRKADDIPLIIGGDFNSPSHKDWVKETSGWHNGLVVEWPVS